MGTLEPIKGQVEYSADVGGVDTAIQALEQLSAQSLATAKALGSMDTRKGAEDLKALGTAADGADGKLVGTADKIRKLGQAFTEIKDFGTATIGKALGEYERFNTSMGQVASLSTEIQANFGQAEQSTLELSRALGIDATAAADAFYQTMSASVKGATDMGGALGFMADAGKAAVGGNLDLKVAVDGMSTALNAWGMDASQATKASDIMFTAVAKGKTTFAEFSSNLFQVGPIAASTGVSLENVAGATATLTKSGTPTSVVMTQLKAVMTELNKPSAGVAQALEHLADKGVIAEASGQALVEAYGGNLPNALQALRDGAEDAGLSYGALFGSVEASSAVLGLTGTNLGTASADLEAMGNSAGATADAYRVMTETFGFQSDQLKSSVQSVFIEIGKTLGQVLVPFMQKLNEVIGAGLEKWNSLGEGTKRFIVTFGGLVAVIGPLVMGFMSLYATLQTASAGAGLLGGAMKLLSASMLTNPVTLVILAISAAVAALITGVQGLNSAVQEQQSSLDAAHQGLTDYAGAVEKADENAGGLAGVIGGIRDAVRDSGLGDHTADIRNSANAWLEYSVGVDNAVLKTRTYQQAKAELDRQFADGKITLDQYQEGLLAAADAASVAAGMGRVLSQEQQKVSQAFIESQAAILARNGAVGEALLKDEEYQQKATALAELVGQGKLAQDDAAQAMAGYVEARSTQIQSDLDAAEAAAQASGAVYTYSDSFGALTQAGQGWVADQEAITEGMGELQKTLEGQVLKTLDTQWQARQEYTDNLAAAAAADAEAQAKAQEQVATSAADHAAKMAELQGKRATEGKDDSYRAKIDEQIAAEGERWATLNAMAETGTQSQTEKVRAAYAEQVNLTREALAQTVIDFVNGQVLLGQTSEDTAKQIFTTLRGAFPDVEVFSPVQEAYTGLMAGISAATKGSEPDIARLPGLIQAIPDQMETSYAEANATLDSWGQDYNLLAQTADTSSSSIMTKDQELGASAEARSSVVLGANESQKGSLLDLEAATATSTSAIVGHNDTTVSSAGARAGGVNAALAVEQGAMEQTAGVSQSTGRAVQGDYKGVADSSRNMADVSTASAGRVQGGLDNLAGGVRTAAQTIGTEYEGAATRFSSAQQTVVSEIGRADTAFATSGGTARTYAGQVSQAGDQIETALGGGADAAEDTGRSAERGLGEAADAAIDAGRKAVDLKGRLEELPKEIKIPVLLEGLEAALAGALKLDTYLTGMPGELSIKITTQHTPLDNATKETPSLKLFHWIQDGVAMANSSPIAITSSYVSGSELLTPGSSGGLAFFDAYQQLVQQTLDAPLVISPRFGDDTEPYLQAGADRNKLLYQEQLESLLRTIESFGSANVDPETMAELARAMAAGDLERGYEKAREALEQLQDAEDRRYDNEIGRLEGLRDAELERLEAQLDAVEKGSNDEERLQKQLDERKKHYEDLLDAERLRHETASGDLDAEAEALAKYYERIGDYEDELRDRRRQRLEDAEAYYDSLQDYEDELSAEVERLLDEREQQAEEAYKAEQGRIQALEEAEQARYDKAKAALQEQIDAIKDEQQAADRLLSSLGRDLKRLELDLNLDQTKDEIDAIKDALSDLPSKDERDPRKRSKKFGLEDIGGDDTRAALEKALAEGSLNAEQQRAAEALLRGRKLAGQDIRGVLEQIEKGLTSQLEEGEALLDQKRRELEYLKLQAEIDKEARQDKLDGLDEIAKGLDAEHKAELARIAEQRTAAKQKLEDDKQAIDELRELEESRHKARLAQIAQEAAIQKALIEGKSEADIKAEIEAAIRLADRAREEAVALLAALDAERKRSTVGVEDPGEPPPGGPAEPPPPPDPQGRTIDPNPWRYRLEGKGPAPTQELEDAVQDGVVAGLVAALKLTAMTPGGDPLTAALTSGAGIVGPASMSVYNTFYGDIYVGDVGELQTLLRSTLGGP